MKILFLNTWSGRVGGPFFKFIKKASKDVDIFCFQEFDPILNNTISKLLESYTSYKETKPYINNWTFDNVTFVKKEIKVIGKSSILSKHTQMGLDLLTLIDLSENRFNVCNFHGVSMPGDKLDSPERKRQSKDIIHSFEENESPVIIGGDFNLNPDTESIRIFEKSGYRNLIKDYKIDTTRNKLAWEYYGKSKKYKFYGKQKFSDYVFVTRDVKVSSFEVPEVLISDHNPMLLEVEI